MSLRGGAETSLAGPEIENIDGFKFVSFENLEEVDKYLRQPLQARRRRTLATTSSQSRAGVKKAAKKISAKKGQAARSTSKVGHSATSAKSAKLKASKATSKASKNSGKKIPVWLKHKRRLRKGDKKVIVDKLHEFVFVSAFTLEDFDKYKEEIDSQVRVASAGAKRKSADRATKPLSVAKKSKKSKEACDDTSGRPVPGGKNLAKDGGKNLAKDVGKPALKLVVQGDILPASSSRPDLVCLTSSICPIDGATVGNTDGASHRQPVASLPEPETSSKRKTKNRKRHYPRMQIDEAYDKTVSSSSESNSSVITISDGPDQENIFLDVINVDNESTSAQFIQNSIKMVNERKTEGELEEQRPESDKTNKNKTKKKKCRICCLYPSKIVEAKKICPLFGSSFPSYTVSCISTCKQHPPGEIIVQPSSSKIGFVDTCIQTNAPDIRMHQHFAHRFPHRTIAVTTHCSRTLEQPKPRRKHEFLSKSEHHRSSEQKRREQMHDQYTELRQVITTSQAMPDNERASKQWILEHAKQTIATLEAEAVVLEALQKTLAVKNERLKKRWKELSGKEFDPKIIKHKNCSESPGQTKLMNLYKQYRKNVAEAKPAESPTVGDNVCGAVESNQSVATSQPNSQSGKASLDNLKNNTSQAMSNAASTATAGHSSETVSSSAASHDSIMATSKASQPVGTRNPSQISSPVIWPSHDTCTNEPSQAAVFSKQSQSSSTVAANPTPTVVVKSSQAITKTPTISAGIPSQPKTSSAPGPVSNQSTAPAKISSHPNAASSPNPNLSRLSQESQAQHQVLSQPASTSSRPKAVNSPSPTSSARMPSPPSSLLASSQPAVQGKPTSPAEVINNPTVVVRMPTRTIAVRMPGRATTMNVTNRFIAVNQSKQAKGTAVNLPTQVIPIKLNISGPPGLLIPLSKLNQALRNKTPTQWSVVSKLSQPEVNELPLEADLGAVIEVGGAGEPDNHKNDIVLLDVAQTEHKSASNIREQVRTLSRIPTSSSISVTLKSVGSITSNKIFNKKPIPSKQKPQLGLQVNQTNQIKNPIQETEASEQKEKVQLEPTFGQLVPQISETLLAETFQDGKNVVDSTNESGLCVISSVFSLSAAKPEDTPSSAVDACAKEVSKDVHVNCNSTIHDHNYCKCETN